MLSFTEFSEILRKSITKNSSRCLLQEEHFKSYSLPLLQFNVDHITIIFNLTKLRASYIFLDGIFVAEIPSLAFELTLTCDVRYTLVSFFYLPLTIKLPFILEENNVRFFRNFPASIYLFKVKNRNTRKGVKYVQN